MGALESKRWIEIPEETPQKSSNFEGIEDDPRSPSFQYNRTPILLQEYDESPQNMNSKSAFQDPRSPSYKITRTPLSKTPVNEGDVFETAQVDGVSNPAFCSSSNRDQKTEFSSLRKDKACLKNTTSPNDYKRRNRLNRRQSLPQKLFSDKGTTLPRSPLAQRNNSMPEENSHISGNKKKFTFVPRKKNYTVEVDAEKENSVKQVLL